MSGANRSSWTENERLVRLEQGVEDGKMNNALPRLLHAIEEYAGGLEYGHELKQAKEKFFSPVGAPGKNGARADAELELANFIEWFIFDWKLPDGESIWANFVRFRGAKLDPEDLDALKQLSRQNYSLFLVKKTGPGKTAVKDMVSGETFKPVQNLVGALRRGDMFLGRMITINGQYYFTEAIFVIPRSLEKIYKPRAKLVRKGGLRKDEFTDELRGLAMKTIRYPRMKLEEFYK